MNETVPAARPIPYYLVVVATAFVMAIVLSPTPDAISVALLLFITVPASVVLGAVARHFRRRSPRLGKSTAILPIIVGIAGSFLGLGLVTLVLHIA